MVHHVRPASVTYCARLSIEDAEIRRWSLRREPKAAVKGGAPLCEDGLPEPPPGAVPPLRMLVGLTRT